MRSSPGCCARHWADDSRTALCGPKTAVLVDHEADRQDCGEPGVWFDQGLDIVEAGGAALRRCGGPGGSILGATVAVGSAQPRDGDASTDAVRRLAQGDLGPDGMRAIRAGMDPSQLALAIRHDPRYRQAALYGLTPGWETLSLGGKPTLDFGQSGLEAQQINAAMPPVACCVRPGPSCFGPPVPKIGAVRCAV